MSNPLYDRLVQISRPALPASGYGAAERAAEQPLIQTVTGVPQSQQSNLVGTWQFQARGIATAIPASVQMQPRARGNNPVGLVEDVPRLYFNIYIDGVQTVLDVNGLVTEIRENDRVTDVTDAFQRRFVIMGVYPTAFGYQILVERARP